MQHKSSLEFLQNGFFRTGNFLYVYVEKNFFVWSGGIMVGVAALTVLLSDREEKGF